MGSTRIVGGVKCPECRAYVGSKCFDSHGCGNPIELADDVIVPPWVAEHIGPPEVPVDG